MPLLLLASALSILLLLRSADLADRLPGCLLYHLTGLYCPGCGATRCFELLARGEFTAALGMNLLLPFVAVVALSFCLPANTIARVCRSRAFGWAAVAIVVAFTIVRNLPWEPFRFLAPGAMFAR